MSNLAELVVKCARRLGDAVMVKGTATATTTTFIDTLHIDADRRHWGGSQIFFYDSTKNNFGLDRFILGATSATLTWSVAVANAPVLNDPAIIVNARGKGWELDEYKNAINDGIGRIRGVVMQHREHVDIAAGFDRVFNLPANFDEIYEVEWFRQHYDTWVTVPKAHGRNGDGWSVESDGTLRLSGPVAYGNLGAELRVSGYRYQPELEDWDDELIVEETPVIEYAVLALTKQGIDRDNRNPILFTPNENDAKTSMTRYRTVRRRGSMRVSA